MPSGVYTRTEETKKKMSSSHMGKPKNPHSIETRHKISKGNKGKRLSEETKKKMSESKRNMSIETKHKMSKAQTGRKLSEETKRKMSIAKQNMSEETKKKISNANKGKIFSKEHRKNLSEALLGKPKSKPSEECKLKMRLKRIQRIKELYGQIFPIYNKKSISIIEEYGKTGGYSFQHAENGGEYFIKELGYWVDGYDKTRNVVIEYYKKFHYDFNGNLKEKELNREQEIINYLKCKLIRINALNKDKSEIEVISYGFTRRV